MRCEDKEAKRKRYQGRSDTVREGIGALDEKTGARHAKFRWLLRTTPAKKTKRRDEMKDPPSLERRHRNSIPGTAFRAGEATLNPAATHLGGINTEALRHLVRRPRAKQSHGSRRVAVVRHGKLGKGTNEVPQTSEVSSST